MLKRIQKIKLLCQEIMKAELGRPLMMMMAEVFNTTSSGMMCDCYCDYC